MSEFFFLSNFDAFYFFAKKCSSMWVIGGLFFFGKRSKFKNCVNLEGTQCA